MVAQSGQRSSLAVSAAFAVPAIPAFVGRATRAADADLFGDTVRGPSPRTGDGEASHWWLPGPARLCLVTGSVAIEVRKRRFASLPRIALLGPTDRAHRIVATRGSVVSVAMTPLGWSRLSRRAASEYRNVVVPVEDVLLPRAVAALADRVDSAREDEPICRDSLHALLTPLTVAHRDEALVVALAAMVREHASVQVRDLHDRLGISEARLRSLALRHFGTPAKILLRRARFLHSLAKVDFRAGHNSYANIDPTYHDVPHFLRDAHFFLGTTPRRFRLLSSQH